MMIFDKKKIGLFNFLTILSHNFLLVFLEITLRGLSALLFLLRDPGLKPDPDPDKITGSETLGRTGGGATYSYKRKRRVAIKTKEGIKSD